MSPDGLEAIPGLTLFRPDHGTQVSVTATGAHVVEVTATAESGVPGVRVEVDLADAVGYWHPGIRGAAALPADWAGPVVTSLVRSAPAGALYDAAGEVLLGWAAAEAISEVFVHTGVSEERKSFVVEIRPRIPRTEELAIVVDGTRSPLAETIRRLGAWLSARCSGEARTPPAIARRPVYSTWYTFTQDIDADVVTDEAARAARLGCGSVFIDDGWQQHAHGRGYQGCGDWLPDESKFASLRSTVHEIHGYGAGVGLWIAPLLLGRESAAHRSLAPLAGHWEPLLNCHVLDPRHPETRDFVADTCVRLVEDYDVDVLKIDFLDQAMVYRDSTGAGDLSDLGQAMATMLARLRRRLVEAGRGDVAFEFRQPYVSPAIARYGEILRASDCPADAHVNRLATIDARLISTGQVVHSDPMMWGRAGGAEAVAQQLYSGWFAVPQISMRLSDLGPAQTTALLGLLQLWDSLADVTMDGALQVHGAEHGYHLVRAARPDLGRSVVARYAPLVVDLDDQPTAETTVINATPDDRLVVRTSRAITAGITRNATGAAHRTIVPSGPGLVELAVPAWGSVTIQASSPAD